MPDILNVILLAEFTGALTSFMDRESKLKLPRIGTCLPRRYKADLKRCVPIWSWCRAMLPYCMK